MLSHDWPKNPLLKSCACCAVIGVYLQLLLADSLAIAQTANTLGQRRSLDDWTYIQVDDERGKWGDFDAPKNMKYFGLDMRDVTGDGYRDIVSGRYFYRNPGGDMTGKWPRSDLGLNVDGMLFVDVDGDQFGDVIAEALPDVYWLEAVDRAGTSWRTKKIGTITETKHVNGQGYELAQLIAGGKPEIVLAAKGVYYFEIPDDPTNSPWPRHVIAPNGSEEGIGVGDIDQDGDLDIAIGVGDNFEGRQVTWCENPGIADGTWKQHRVGTTDSNADRFEAADIDDDGDIDIVVAEETGKGGANVFWFECPADPLQAEWRRHTVTTQFTTNNLDVADVDGDGDIDLITAEHRGPKKVAIWENMDSGREWKQHVVSKGKESHLGAQVADMDGDGDLDLLSIAWDNYAYLHLWRNDNQSRSP